MSDITSLIDLPAYDPNMAPLNTVEIMKVFLPLTLSELIKRERLTRTQASRVRDGLRWAERFGLIRHEPWKHYRFDLGDVKTALVLSIIVEAARKA